MSSWTDTSSSSTYSGNYYTYYTTSDWFIKDIKPKKKEVTVDLETTRDALKRIHKDVEQLQEEMITRGYIGPGEVPKIKPEVEEEQETPQEELLYFDPKDLDLCK